VTGEAAARPRTGPLTGVRVVELAGIGPAPFATMLLADLGADVVRVDRPGGGTALVPAERDVLGRGKRSVVVDLSSSDGAARVLDLVEHADVLVEGFRPGVAERLGIGPAPCLARRPGLVYGRMTGWGQAGPRAQQAGHDLTYIAPTGTLAAIGRADQAPAIPLNLVGDMGGGAMYLVAGVLAALLESRSSGRGQVVDAAIVDGAAHLDAMVHCFVQAGVWDLRRGSNLLDGGAPFYSVYETADGRYLAVGALEPQFYAALVAGLGLDEPLDRQNDRSRWPGLRDRIAARIRSRTRDDWVAVFEGTDACVAPVLDMTEAPTDPHLAARGVFVEAHGTLQPAPAPRFSHTPADLDGPPPALGSSTVADVLASWATP
jgi:alpha-methylacyl-CoA racemase